MNRENFGQLEGKLTRAPYWLRTKDGNIFMVKFTLCVPRLDVASSRFWHQWIPHHRLPELRNKIFLCVFPADRFSLADSLQMHCILC